MSSGQRSWASSCCSCPRHFALHCHIRSRETGGFDRHNVLPSSRTHLLGAFRVLEQPQQNEVHCGASTRAVRGIPMSRIACTVVGFLQQVAARDGDESTVAREGLCEFTNAWAGPSSH